jgi:ribose transport system permease protein
MIIKNIKNTFLVDKINNPVGLAFIISILLLIIGQIISPGFATLEQIINLLIVASFLGIVAGGQTLVIMSGNSGIDLSVGNVVTMGAIIGGALIKEQNENVLLGLIVVLAITFIVGLLNGIGSTYFNIPPLIMTLSMGIIVQAISKFITGGVPVGGAAPILRNMVIGRFLGIPGILYIWLAFSILIIIVLRNSTYGLYLLSVGANDKAAYLSGVPVRLIRILTYGFGSMIAGASGFFYLGYLGSVYNITLGDKYTLPSIIAVVIGGTSLAGGSGGYIGTIAGAIVLQILESILITINIEQFGRNIIFGLVLLGLMFSYARGKKLRV